MKLLRLKNTSNNFFKQAWELYEDTFPIHERRLLKDQFYVLKNDNYHFDILMNHNQFIGFILWWEFETYNFIDHFATCTQQRNKGYGKLILDKFIENNKRPTLLEVELPISTLNERRIKFYERIGFKLNQHHYTAPALQQGQSPYQLLLMSYPDVISKIDVEQFIKTGHPVLLQKESDV